MKRRYPISRFLIGILQNMIRYCFILLLAVIFFVIGAFHHPVCLYIGIAVVCIYFLICIIEQFIIRAVSLRPSNNQAFNNEMDKFFGIEEGIFNNKKNNLK